MTLRCTLSGFHAVGVTRDDEAFALLDTGQFSAVLVGSGVELAPADQAARGPTRNADPRSPPGADATVQQHVRDVIVPKPRRLG
jgi:hypothetical protein